MTRPTTASNLLALVCAVALAACGQQHQPFDPGDATSLARAEDLALEHLRQHPEALGDVEALEVTRVVVDQLGAAHVRVAQHHNGVAVWGGDAVIHLDADGAVMDISDSLVRGVELDVTPSLRADEATEIAVLAVGGPATLSDDPVTDLLVYPRTGAAALVWRVQLRQLSGAAPPAMPVLFIDAKLGDVVDRYDNLQASSLRDADKETWDMNSTKRYQNAIIVDTNDNDTVGNDAHAHAGLALAYFAAAHGRDSFDGNGAVVKNYVHYDRSYVNAFWDGQRLSFGDGDGIKSNPLVVLDVVAHELSHGVTERTANLIYSGESGALNEATSDIFAAAVEFAQLAPPVDGGPPPDDSAVWLVGEDCWLQPADEPTTRPPALRYMDDPALDSDPDHYSVRLTDPAVDNGGVHSNSGIANLAFYLMSKGGVHPRGRTTNVVAPIGVEAAADIWYHALSTTMTAGETFAEAHRDTAASARALFPLDSSYEASVHAAWTAVGVAEAAPPPPPPTFTVVSTESGLTLARRRSLTRSFSVPAGTDQVRFKTAGSNGDADLYVRRGSAPTTSTYDCRSAGASSNESCTLTVPASSSAQTYYVMVYAYAAFNGLTLTYETGDAP